MNASMTLGDRSLPVEVMESLVRGYLVVVAPTPGAPIALEPGARVELIIGDTPPVPCTVAATEATGVRLLRGWGPPARRP